MSFTMLNGPVGGVVPPSPPDDPKMPHAWVARTWEDRTGLVSFHCRCDGCGVVVAASFRPSDYGDALRWAQAIRRWPVPADCLLALAHHIMTE